MGVDSSCFSVIRPWLAGMLSCCCSFWGMLTRLALTIYPGLFCHLHLCPGLSFHFCIISCFFKIVSLFSSGPYLVTKIKDLSGNPRFPLLTLFAKKFSCCVSYSLVEVDYQGVKISLYIYGYGKCKFITYLCLESQGRTWFLAGFVSFMLRRAWKVIITMSPSPMYH